MPEFELAIMYMILYAQIPTPALLGSVEHGEVGKWHVVSVLVMPF